MSPFKSWEAVGIPHVLGYYLCSKTWTLPRAGMGLWGMHTKNCVRTTVPLAAGFHRLVEMLVGRDLWMSLI